MAHVRVSLIAVAAAAFAAAAPGFAKGPDTATVCGATRCTTVHGESAVYPFLAWTYRPFSSRTAPPPAPYFTFRLRDPSGIRWTILYVPARHAVRIWQSRVPPYQQGIGPYWRSLPADASGVFRRAVGALRPFPRPSGWGR